MTVLGEAFISILPLTGAFLPKLETEIKAAANAASVSSKSTFDNVANFGKAALLGIAGVAVGAGVVAVKMAGDFQAGLTSLVTGAGEAESNLGLVKKGIMDLAVASGTSTKQLVDGMFLIESAGYHGAIGLTVLKAAAEGAKVGNAELKTVADGLTTVLNAYGLKASDAAKVTSQMVEVVALGKTHMEDLAKSMSAVLPFAAAAGVSFAQVGGAIATMTSQGVSAQQSAQDLANLIRALQNPSQVATKEMAQMGIQSVDLAKNLGRDGLTGTLDTLVTAITQHMGPAGLVLQSAFNESKYASRDALIELHKLPPSLQDMAQKFFDGTITTKEWRHEISLQSGEAANLARQFTATTNRAHGFSQIIRSGSPDAQTFTAALSEMTGGATGAGTALLLTGEHMATFKDNVDKVSNATVDGAGHVKGFALVQKDFNFQVDQARAYLENVAIRVGDWLIPRLLDLAHTMGDVVGWFQKHKEVAEALAVVIGGALLVTIGAYVVKLGIAVAETIALAAHTVAHLVALGLLQVALLADALGWDGVTTSALAAAAAENIALLGIPILIAAVVAALVWVVTHWEKVKQIAVDAFNWIYDHWYLIPVFGPFIGAVKTVIDHFGQLLDFFEKLPGRTAAFFVALPDLILGAIKALPGLLETFVLNLLITWPLLLARKAVEAGTAIISGIVDGLTAAAHYIFDWLTKLPGHIGDFVGGLSKPVAKFGSDLIDSIVGGMTDTAHRIFDWFTDLPGHIGDFVGGLFGGSGGHSGGGTAAGSLRKSGKGIVDSIVDGLGDGLGAIFKFFDDLPGKILDHVQSGAGKPFVKFGKSIVDDIVTGLGSGVDAIVTFFGNIPGWILDGLKALPNLLLNFLLNLFITWPLQLVRLAGQLGLSIVEGIVDGLAAAVPAIWDWMSKLPGDLIRVLTGIIKQVWKVGTAIVDAIVDGLKDTAKTLWDWFSGVPDAIFKLLAHPSQIVDAGGKIVDAIVEGMGTAVKAVWDFISGIPDDIAGFFSGSGGGRTKGAPTGGAAKASFHAAGQSIISSILEGLGSAVTDIFGWFEALPGKILDHISTGLGKSMSQLAKNLVDGLVSGLATAGHAVYDWFAALPDGIARLGYDLSKTAAHLTDSLITGLNQKTAAVYTWFTGLPDKIAQLTFDLDKAAGTFLAAFVIAFDKKVGQVTDWFARLPEKIAGVAFDFEKAAGEFLAAFVIGLDKKVGTIYLWFTGLPEKIAGLIFDFEKAAGEFLAAFVIGLDKTIGKIEGWFLDLPAKIAKLTWDLQAAAEKFLANFIVWLNNNSEKIGEWLLTLTAEINKWVITHGPQIWAISNSIIDAIVVGLVLGIPTLTNAIGDAIIVGVVSGVVKSQTQAIKALVDGLSSSKTDIQNVYRDAPLWLEEHGREVARGFFTGLISAWHEAEHFFGDAKTAILVFFNDAGVWLLETGRNLIRGFFNGIAEVWNASWHWFFDRKQDIFNFFIDVGVWLLETGRNLIRGFFNGIADAWNASWHWFFDRKNDVLNFFADAVSWLFVRGRDLIFGFFNGIISFWNESWHWFIDRKNDILNFFADAGTWLVKAGGAIVQGLIDGISAAWNLLRPVINIGIGIINWLPDHLNDLLSAIGAGRPIPTIPTMAKGGLLGGHDAAASGFRTQGPAIVGEGNPSYPEYVIATDPAFRHRSTRLFTMLANDLGQPTLPGLAGGGIVGEAQSWYGVPYLWGGGHGGVPEAVARRQGVDCSGLVIEVFRKFGINLEGNTNTQIHAGAPVGALSVSNPGDLVFFGGIAPGESHHVGIVTSPGTMIDAPHTGTVVRNDVIAGFGAVDGIRRIIAGGGGIPGASIFSGIGGFITGILGDILRLGADAVLAPIFATANGLADTVKPKWLSQFFHGGIHKIHDAIVNFVTGKANAAAGALAVGGGTFGAPPGAPANISANAALGRSIASIRNWVGPQWDALFQLGQMESGWNQFARNPTSGAYGIAQALPESKYPFAGTAAGGSNPGVQIQWMLDYIAGRYGTPINALAHENAFHWYDIPYGTTAVLPPTRPGQVGHYKNTTGHDEYVSRTPGGHGGGNVQVQDGAVTIEIHLHGGMPNDSELRKLQDVASQAVHDGMAEVLDRYTARHPGGQ